MSAEAPLIVQKEQRVRCCKELLFLREGREKEVIESIVHPPEAKLWYLP